MNTELEHRAWHIAGHAYAAAMCGFSVHKLALDGFSDADIEQRGTARRLDPWTMIRVPNWDGVNGGRDHARVIEGLMSIAVAGPCAELLHREMPCDIAHVQQFAIDWDQAWKSAGFFWEEEPLRRSWLERWIHSSPAVISYGAHDFYTSVAGKLREEGTMTGEEVQAAWDRLKAAEKRSRCRREPLRKPVLLDFDDPECPEEDCLMF